MPGPWYGRTRYLVLSFLYRMGEADPFITGFLKEVPEDTGGEALKPGQMYLGPAVDN